MAAEEKRLAVTRRRSLLTVAGLRCALRLGQARAAKVKAATAAKEAFEKAQAEAAEAKVKADEAKAAEEAKVAEAKAAEEAKVAEAKAAEEAKDAEAEAADEAKTAEEVKAAEESEPKKPRPKPSQRKVDKKAEAKKEAKAQVKAKAAEKTSAEAEPAVAKEGPSGDEAAAAAPPEPPEVEPLFALGPGGGGLVGLAEAWRRLAGKPAKVPVLHPKRWHVLTLVVQGGAPGGPKTSVYLDGKDTRVSLLPKVASAPPSGGGHGGEDLPSFLAEAASAAGRGDSSEALEKLGLGRRLVLFGGGRQIETKGGALRRVRVGSGAASPAAAAHLGVVELPALNPLFKASATLIQTLARRVGAKARVHKIREAKAQAEAKEVAADAFRAGNKVEARYIAGDEFFAGVVAKNNGDGTYDIEYDDVRL